jgi:hypothetical protein
MTTVGRAIISIWTAMGISMFALLLPLGLSGRADQQVCVAVVWWLASATLLGLTANAREQRRQGARESCDSEVEGTQFACAVVLVAEGRRSAESWHRGVGRASLFGTVTSKADTIAFLAAWASPAIFFCQIVFGIYAMIPAASRAPAQAGVA